MATRQYLWTIAELQQHALTQLGPMDAGDYAFFMQKARENSACQGVKELLLGIGINFKPGAHPQGIEEYAYPCNSDEWAVFQSDSKMMCTSMPNVFVLDGEKFTLPI